MNVNSRYRNRLATEEKLNNINANALIKQNNLGDLSNVQTARTNLNVYSKTESDLSISQAAVVTESNINANLAANYISATQFEQQSYKWDNFVQDPTFSLWKDFVSPRLVSADTDLFVQNSNCAVGNTLNTGVLSMEKSTIIPDIALTNYSGENNSLRVTVNTIQPTSPLTGKAQVRWSFDGIKLALIKDKTVTFYVWVYTNKTGNYSLTVKTTPKTASLSKAYTKLIQITAVNTWVRAAVTLPMTWYQVGSPPDDYFDERPGFQVLFTLAADTTVLSTPTADTWVASNVEYLTSQTNNLDSTSNQWFFSDAQLEVSSQATQFRNTSTSALLNGAFKKSTSTVNNAMNSGYEVNQRAAASYTVATGDSAYTLDLVNVFGGSNGSGTTVSQGVNTGLFKPVFSNYLDCTFTGTDAFVRHSIAEDVRLFSGKVVTVSFWANQVSGAASSIKMYLRQYANVTGPVVQNTVKKDFLLSVGTPIYCQATFIMPDVSSLTLTSTAHLAAIFYLSQPTTTQTVPGRVQITGLRLEEGFEATPWYNTPFADELLACQRYYEKTYNYNVAPGATADYSGCLSTISGGNAIGNVQGDYFFKVEKRTSPTVTFYNPQTGVAGTVRRSNAADVAVGALNTGTKKLTWANTAASANSPIRHDVHCVASSEF